MAFISILLLLKFLVMIVNTVNNFIINIIYFKVDFSE